MLFRFWIWIIKLIFFLSLYFFFFSSFSLSFSFSPVLVLSFVPCFLSCCCLPILLCLVLLRFTASTCCFIVVSSRCLVLLRFAASTCCFIVVSSHCLVATLCCLVVVSMLPCATLLLPRHCLVHYFIVASSLPHLVAIIHNFIGAVFLFDPPPPICCFDALLPHTSLFRCLVASLPCRSPYFPAPSTFIRGSSKLGNTSFLATIEKVRICFFLLSSFLF